MGKVCLEKESGGLRVRRVKEFNLSLLGKWCWRLFNEPKRLWCKVLKAKYGSRDGQVVSGVNKASSWWKYLISIMDGSAVGEESWCGDKIKKKVGNGESCLFWKDAWLEGGSLKSRYGRFVFR
jgi:hypothetical protein